MDNTKRYFIGAATVLLLAVAACGSNDDNNDAFRNVLQPPVAVGDSFINAVLGIAAASPDDAEPGEIDSIAVTLPDDSESVTI
jgi:hypothetical protein